MNGLSWKQMAAESILHDEDVDSNVWISLASDAWMARHPLSDVAIPNGHKPRA